LNLQETDKISEHNVMLDTNTTDNTRTIYRYTYVLLSAFVKSAYWGSKAANPACAPPPHRSASEPADFTRVRSFIIMLC